MHIKSGNLPGKSCNMFLLLIVNYIGSENMLPDFFTVVHQRRWYGSIVHLTTMYENKRHTKYGVSIHKL